MQTTLYSLWAESSRRRLAWAESAYGSFLASIDPELSRQYRQHGDEVTVVVFGKTQVGKTTLILTLMGVAPENIAQVSHALRGGRPTGRSATATAMLYSRSMDESWHLVIDGVSSTYETHEGLELQLGEVRQNLENGRFRTGRPLHVMLPRAFFQIGSDDDLSVNIIDLPGDSPSSEIEQRHVNEVAEMYIPNADLVLLVGKADDLGFIDPEKLPLPGLGDWRYSPSRFRIITTFSIQSASFRDWLSQQVVVDVGAIRERLLSQLGTFDEVEMPADARLPTLYFPLEFGESWSVLHNMDRNLHARVEPVMKELLTELRQDIRHSASPHMRLWRATQVHVVANRLKRARQRHVQKQVTQFAMEAHQSAQKGEALLSIAERLTREAADLPTTGQFNDAKNSLRADIAVKTDSKLLISDEVKSNVSELLAVLHDSVQFLIRVASECEFEKLGGIDLLPDKPTPSKMREWVEPLFEPLREKLNNYIFDAYRPWLFKTFATDLADLRRLAANGREQLRAHLYDHWSSVFVQVEERIALRGKELLEQAQVAEKDALTHLLQADSTRRRGEQVSAALVEFVTRLERDEATGHRFIEMLNLAHAEQFCELKVKFESQSTPAAKFMMLLALKQLELEKAYFFHLASPGTHDNEYCK